MTLGISIALSPLSLPIPTGDFGPYHLVRGGKSKASKMKSQSLYLSVSRCSCAALVSQVSLTPGFNRVPRCPDRLSPTVLTVF